MPYEVQVAKVHLDFSSQLCGVRMVRGAGGVQQGLLVRKPAGTVAFRLPGGYPSCHPPPATRHRFDTPFLIRRSNAKPCRNMSTWKRTKSVMANEWTVRRRGEGTRNTATVDHTYAPAFL